MPYYTHLISLHHQQQLTECPRAFPKDFIRGHGDNGAEGEDEGVDVGHVQVVSGDRVRDRVGSHPVGLLSSKANHVLWVHLHGVIAKLGLCDCLSQACEVLSVVLTAQL